MKNKKELIRELLLNSSLSLPLIIAPIVAHKINFFEETLNLENKIYFSDDSSIPYSTRMRLYSDSLRNRVIAEKQRIANEIFSNYQFRVSHRFPRVDLELTYNLESLNRPVIYESTTLAENTVQDLTLDTVKYQ